MECLAQTAPDLLDPLIHLGYGPPVPSILSRRKNSRGTTTGPSNNPVRPSTGTTENGFHKLATCGFLPLPSITASPICTPTSTIHSHTPTSLEDDHSASSSPKSPELYTTAPTTPSGLSIRLITTPTWISTPPTPPPKIIKRSATTVTRAPSPLPSSASFPASTPPHAGSKHSYFMRRRASVPSILCQPRASSVMGGLTHSRSREITKRPSGIGGNSARNAPTNDATITRESATLSARSRSRPKFHIVNDASTDTDEASPLLSESSDRTEDIIVGASLSDAESDGTWSLEKDKDEIRKYHALRELLATEVGYLLDLRALVTVYLRILPTLVARAPPTSTFSRASSFTSGPWINSYSHAQAAAASSSANLMDVGAQLTPAKDHAKPVARYLFTDQEVETLTRNAEDILQLHEHFVRELREEMTPLGFPMEAHENKEELEKHRREFCHNTDAAIRMVSTKFATEASRFNSYQTFCAGHPEALDLVRRVQAQRPVEWDTFEQRCSTMIYELELSTGGSPDASEGRQVATPSESENPISPATKGRNRTSSLSSIDGAVRTLRSRASGILPKETSIAFPSETRKDRSSRLAFSDYMIKPVQRICKYPLVLAQLKPSKSIRALPPAHLRSDVDVVVESATQAMKHVAAAVDEARHRQDVAIQSALIISRISLSSSAIPQSSPQPCFQALTLSFLQSLGTCLLAGSLDVMHYRTQKPINISNISAKYFGAFLYLGGYILLVKVSKHKIYEPKHWLSLADFEVSDIEEDDGVSLLQVQGLQPSYQPTAMLPCSFRVSTKEHRFELAAACQREKDVWLSSIRESRTHSPQWVNEPTSSLRFDGKGEFIPQVPDDGPFEAAHGLPTIQSIPELDSNFGYHELTESLVSALGTDAKQKRPSRHDTWKQDPDPPSRRSSTASVKAMFSPMTSDSETIVIRRSSAPARSRVDQGLRDVISQPCLTARSYANSREELLFQAPKVARAGFVRSHSGLSMAGMAKSRLTRHESVRVLRRKSLIDGSDAAHVVIPIAQTLATRRHTKNLSITAMSECDTRPSSWISDSTTKSPSPLSPNFTVPAPQSSLTSDKPNHSIPNPKPETRSPLKSSRSLVSNMKGLFQARASSPTSLPVPSEMDSQTNKTVTPGSLKCWTKGTLHRRARSAPDVPDDLPQPSLVPNNIVITVPNTPISTSHSSDTTFDPLVARRLSAPKPIRRKSLLSSSTFRGSLPETDSTYRSPIKNINLLQRLKA